MTLDLIMKLQTV